MDYGNIKLQHPSKYAYEMAKANIYQRVCEKHEMVLVTQTTSTAIGNLPTSIVDTRTWMQCKNCGYTHPIIEQSSAT
jgi:hypothetical protein